MRLQQIISFGSEHLPYAQASKVRIMNIIALITTCISALYTSYYGLVLQVTSVATINSLFTFAYMGSLLLNYLRYVRASKIWFFSVLMLHLVICTNVYLTTESGFHLYYFLVPTGAFLLFNLNEKKEKILLSSVAVVLFFISENMLNPAPLIELSQEMNHIIYQSVVFVIMVEVIIVLTLFASQMERNEEELIRQANTDSLTGIANRRSFFELAHQLVKNARNNQQSMTIIIIDFDNFKLINDQHGHFAGDLCLIEICNVVKKLCRNEDVFARFGGEEFVIALPKSTIEEAHQVAERMRVAIAEKSIPIVGQQHFRCTASFGISGNQDGKIDLQQMLVNADNALYAAKNSGRNRVNVFNQSESG